MVALSSDLSDVQKSRTDQEEAKRTAEETIERERKEHDEKVSKMFLIVCLFVYHDEAVVLMFCPRLALPFTQIWGITEFLENAL